MTTSATTTPGTTGPTAFSAPHQHDASSDVSLLGSLWTLFMLTLRQHVRGKRWMIMGVLFLLPAGLAILIRSTAREVPSAVPEFLLAWMFVPQILLPLVALVYASGIIQDEQEEQTITYLLMRPIPKWAIYLVKQIATLVTTVVLVSLFTTVTYAAVFAGSGADFDVVRDRCLNTIGIHSLAVIAYCCLFGLMSLVIRRTLVIGILYIAVVEGVLANMPFGIRLGTVIYYTRLIAYRTMDFVVEHRYGRTENLAAEAWQLDLKNDPQLLLHPEYATCFRVLIIASIVCALLAAWRCSRAEFHVKTPEKD